MTQEKFEPGKASEEEQPPPLYRDKRTATSKTVTQIEKRPIYPIHPGTILAEELAELHITPADAARELHVPSNRLYQLIAGKRAMTADTVLRLEQWLDVTASFWMNLQKSYELDLAAEQIGEEIKHTVHRRAMLQEQALSA